MKSQVKKHIGIERRAYKVARSFIRGIYRPIGIQNNRNWKPGRGIKIASIHNERRILTGAHYINQIMTDSLTERGAQVRNFYPRGQAFDMPIHMRGFANILFFYSLLEQKDKILQYHVIQGTTYTTLPFLSFNVPLVSHFGSTTSGFLSNTPKTKGLLPSEIAIWRELRKFEIVPGLELQTSRPLYDIADIEKLVATRVTKCVATSEQVRGELLDMGVLPDRIEVIHNAIEDYWFDTRAPIPPADPHIVFLGRLGGDIFTLKLKGLTRLIGLYRFFPNVQKTTICMTTNKTLKAWLRVSFPKHYMFVNLRKSSIPNVLSRLFGSILFVPSRYEGFSLSLVEGMSQGLVPITYSVGVAPEIIRNGENGFVVSTIEEAEERIRELLSDADKRLAMAVAARKTADMFRSGTIADKLITLYRNIRPRR